MSKGAYKRDIKNVSERRDKTFLRNELTYPLYFELLHL